MGVRNLVSDDGGCFYDSVTMTAFGPVIRGDDMDDTESILDDFQDFILKEYGKDPRKLTSEELHKAFIEFTEG